MATQYECQLEDDGDDWTVIDRAYDEECAAETFAESCDCKSGGETFQEPGRDELRVRVRRVGDTTVCTVVVSFDYSKTFYSRIDQVEDQPAAEVAA